MQLTHLLGLGFSLASLTTATQGTAMDAPALKSLFTTLSTNLEAVDKAVQAITDANVATQIPLIVKDMETLNTALLTNTETLKKSTALGILDITSLTSSIAPMQKTMLTLMTDIISKRSIIVKGNQVEALGAGLKKQQVGFDALQDAMLTQLPQQLVGNVPKASDIKGFNVDMKLFQDLMFDIVIAVFKGTDSDVKVKASLWPMPAGAKRAVGFEA